MHKPNQIVVLEDKTKVKVEPTVDSFPCAYFCYFGKQEFHLGFNYKCDVDLVGKQLGGCEAPDGYCYNRITKFRRGV